MSSSLNQVVKPWSGAQVSAVITCYNYGRYLREAVESVLGQTYRDVEVIIVDDGSTDETPQLATSWRNDPRIRYVRQENAGQAAAKNHGLHLAQAPLVAFLDADDRWDPTKLAKQVPLFARHAVGVVYSRGLFLDGSGATRVPSVVRPHGRPRAGHVTTALLYDNFVPFSSAVARRDLLEQVGGFDENLAMSIDWDLWLRMSRRCEFDWVDEPLLHYRVGHGDQMSRQILTRLECCERILAGFLARHGSELPAREVRGALAYSYAQRGEHLEPSARGKALRYYARSLAQLPAYPPAWRGIARLVLRPRAG